MLFFRFGAEKVLLASGLIWGLLTFWFQKIVHVTAPDLKLVVFTRILIGAAQGVHFPALVSSFPITTTYLIKTNQSDTFLLCIYLFQASISSKNLNTKDRSFFFSATTAGSAMGTLLTGTIGSYFNDTFGWDSVFYTIGKKISLSNRYIDW